MDELLWLLYWHFLESLLYCADSRAISDNEIITDPNNYRDDHAYKGHISKKKLNSNFKICFW